MTCHEVKKNNQKISRRIYKLEFWVLLKKKKISFKAMCYTDAALSSAREIASMALPAARESHTENV